MTINNLSGQILLRFLLLAVFDTLSVQMNIHNLKMIIKDIQPDDRLKNVKVRIYEYVRKMTQAFTNSNISLIQLFFFYIVFALPFASILFKNQNYFPEQVSQILRGFLITNLQSSLGIDWKLVDAIIISWTVSIILLTLVHFTFDSVNQSVTFTLSMFIKICSFFSVPLAIQSVLNPQTESIRKIIYGVMIPLCTFALISLLTLELFQIRCLRKKTLFWSLDNSAHFFAVLFSMYRTAAISLGSDISTWCVIGLLVWLYRLQSKKYISENQWIVECGLYDLTAATDAGVLISILTGNRIFGFGSWLVLLSLAVGRSVIAIIQAKNTILYIPKCSSGPEKFYNFFYLFKQKYEGSDQNWKNSTVDRLSSIYHLHRLHCEPKKCQLNTFLGPNKKKSLETLISDIIESKSSESMENKILNMLWNLELGNKVEVKGLSQKPNIRWSQEYVIWCIDKLNNDSKISLITSQSNKELFSKAFYDIIIELSQHYSIFYDQLTRPNPLVDVLVEQGINISEKVKRLKDVQSQLLKQKMMTYKMMELYNEFTKIFVGDSAQNLEDINRLMKNQTDYFQDISENSVPTFTFFPDNGSLQNVNAEGQKFLQSTRFQIKTSKVSDITVPSISIQLLKTLVTKTGGYRTEQKYYSFFKGYDDLTVGSNFTVKELTLQEKAVLVLQIVQEPFSPLKNTFLVSTNFELQQSLNKSVKIKEMRYRSKPLKLEWKQLFQQYIVPNKQKLNQTKLIKVATSFSDCILIAKKKRSAFGNYDFIEAHIVVETDLSTENKLKDRKSSIISFNSIGLNQPSSKFFFEYEQNEDSEKAVLLGLTGSLDRYEQTLKTKTLTPFQKAIQSNLVTNVLNEDQNLADGIKTYRLYQGDLYNIDLQDRQAYNEQFEIHQVEEHKVQITKSSSFQKYLLVGILVLGLTLIGLSAYSIYHFQSESKILKNYSQMHTNIQSLMLDLNRIMAVLKDKASGFDSQFGNYSTLDQINKSYNRLQILKKFPLFQNDQHILDFQGVQFKGQLIQLVNILLAHVNEVLYNGDLSAVQDIHFSYIELIQVIQFAEEDTRHVFQVVFSGLTDFKNVIRNIILVVLILLFFLMFLFCYLSNLKLKSNLSPLLFTPDSTAITYQQNADKAKNAVDMIRKNFQIDAQSLMTPIARNKRRKRPKVGALSKQKVLIVIILCAIGLVINLTCILLFSLRYESLFKDQQIMIQQSEALLQVYSGSLQLVILVSHTGVVQNDEIDRIKANMHFLSYNLNQYHFSPEFTTRLNTIFFENSCTIMNQRYNLSQQDCSSTAPQFTIQNPFEMGLLYYFNRQNYYFYNNVTETFAHTSVHSQIFTTIYIDLMTSMNGQMLSSIDKLSDQVSTMNIIVITIDCCYILVFIIVYCYFQKQLKHIEEIIEFFKVQTTYTTKDIEEDQQTEPELATQKVEEEQQDEDAPLNVQKPSRFQKTTTLNKMKMQPRDHEQSSDSNDD